MMKSLICEGCDSILTVHLSCLEEIWQKSVWRGFSGASTTSLGGLTAAFVFGAAKVLLEEPSPLVQLRPHMMWLRGFPLKPFLIWTWLYFLAHQQWQQQLVFCLGCWRPNFPLVWPHGPGSQQIKRSWHSIPGSISTGLRWPGFHSWRWGHGGDVDVLVGDVFVCLALDGWWGAWRLDVEC